MNSRIPNILAVLPGFIPSTLMQVVNPLLALEKMKLINFRATLEFYIRQADLRWADLVVFCRNTEPKYFYILETLLQKSIPFIYDIDDNLFEIPTDTPLGQYHRSPERLATLSSYIQLASLVRVYSPPLEERVRELNPAVVRVVPPLQWDLIRASSHPRQDELIKIIYVTSRSDDNLWSIFLPAVKQVLHNYPGKVAMVFWGYSPPEVRKSKGVFSLPSIKNYNRFMRAFSKKSFDIGLAPLPNEEFYRSKTNNKFREYGACKIAGIYSQTPIYRDCVTDGVTGLLVKNDPDAWYDGLVRLIEDQALRVKIANSAYAYVRERYSEEVYCSILWEQIQSLIHRYNQQKYTRDFVQEEHAKLPIPNRSGKIKKLIPWLISKLRDNRFSFFDWIWSHAQNISLQFRINFFGRY